MWSAVRLMKKTAYIQARSFKAITLGENGKECQAEGEANVVEWKAPFGERTNIARDLFIELEDKEFKETIKNARQKLESSVALAMPCKIMKKNCRSGVSNEIKNQNFVHSGS